MAKVIQYGQFSIEKTSKKIYLNHDRIGDVARLCRVSAEYKHDLEVFSKSDSFLAHSFKDFQLECLKRYGVSIPKEICSDYLKLR